jgi:hypothetical protein
MIAGFGMAFILLRHLVFDVHVRQRQVLFVVRSMIECVLFRHFFNRLVSCATIVAVPFARHR